MLTTRKKGSPRVPRPGWWRAYEAAPPLPILPDRDGVFRERRGPSFGDGLRLGLPACGVLFERDGELRELKPRPDGLVVLSSSRGSRRGWAQVRLYGTVTAAVDELVRSGFRSARWV